MHNLWEMLDDPIHGNQCDRNMDYKEAKTLLAVYSQEKFSRTAIYMCETIEESEAPSLIEIAECNSGYHRASTCAKTAVDMLNGLHDKNGNRRYNAQLFPLYSFSKWSAIEAELENAMKLSLIHI